MKTIYDLDEMLNAFNNQGIYGQTKDGEIVPINKKTVASNIVRYLEKDELKMELIKQIFGELTKEEKILRGKSKEPIKESKITSRRYKMMMKLFDFVLQNTDYAIYNKVNEKYNIEYAKKK